MFSLSFDKPSFSVHYMITAYMKKIPQKTSGFIALISTIIIALILLVMAIEEGMAGFHARFNILGTEAKEQAVALAEGCADQATAHLITDPSYLGNSTTTLPAGTCHVFPITLNSPAPGLAIVKTQAQVRGSYANLAITLNMASLHLGGTPVSPTTGTLLVYTTVYNNNGGTKTPADFTMNVAGNTPSPSSFSGTASGQAVTLSPGAYSVSAGAISGYGATYSSGCIGAIGAGELKYCIVGEDDLATSLTLLLNVINNNGGTLAPSDFSLLIDGASAANGTRYPMTPGAHAATTTPVAGYTFSAWGGDCNPDGTINLAAGDNKTCIVNADDNPPPSVACADTVMMLSRSLDNGNDLDAEGVAAKALLNLYKDVTPTPKAGVGSYPGVTGTPPPDAEITSSGELSPVIYPGPLYDAIGQIVASRKSGTNVSAAITLANTELDSVRHRPGFSKVMIIVSPSGGHNSDIQAAIPSADAAKADDIGIFTISFTGGVNGDLWAQIATDSSNDQASAALENTDGDHFFISPSSSDMPGIFQTIANLACPAIAAPPPPTPPTTGTLIIHVDMVNDNGGTLAPSDFTVHISGASPSPAGPFTGATLSSDVEVTLDPGVYDATEDPMTGYDELLGANCSSVGSGNIVAGETRLCTIINDDIPPPPPPPDFGVSIGEWEEIPTGG